MLTKFVAILLILIGIAGMILPVVPGILLIITGILLLFKGRLHEIRKLLPEKMPSEAAAIYNSFTSKVLSPHYKMIRDELPLSNKHFILDIGTGPGFLPIMIAEKFPLLKITGIDLSEKMVEMAQKNRSLAKDENGQPIELSNLSFNVMDANSLAFGDNSMDFIMSTGAIHHWKDPVRILDEIYRCLKPGGEAWIYDGYADTEKEDIRKSTSRLFPFFPPAILIKYMLGIHGYTKKEYDTLVKDIFEKSKFKRCYFEKHYIMMRMIVKK